MVCITLLPTRTKSEKIKITLKMGIWQNCAYFFWVFTRWYIPEIDICLKYFLDKKSDKQPLCLVSGIINLVKSLMCQISNPTFILEEFSRIWQQICFIAKILSSSSNPLFFQWKFGKIVFYGTMGANLSWIIIFNCIFYFCT